MIPKIALILTPPFWPNLPPLSLVTLASFLKSQGIAAAVFDFNNTIFNLGDAALKKEWLISANKSLEDKTAELLRTKFKKQFKRVCKELFSYDIVGFSCFKSNFQTALMMAQYLRKEKKQQIKIIFGGPQITKLYFKTNGKFSTEILNTADLIVAGEGEKPLLGFINKKTDKKVIYFEELKNIDNYDYINGYKKFKSEAYPKKQAMPLLFSRGCVRKCKFCSEKLLYKKFRMKSVQAIISEIEYLKKEQGIKQFIFHDSMLNTDLVKLEQLCGAIIEKFGSVPWEAQMGVRTDMSDRLLLKIKKSGCYNIFVGLESGSARTLKNMQKGFTPIQAKQFFVSLKNAGLFFGVSLIVGFPQETEKDLDESLKFLTDNKNLIPKVEQINPFVYYEGTQVNVRRGYQGNLQILVNTEYFIDRLKQEKFKMTKAFINNLVEK